MCNELIINGIKYVPSINIETSDKVIVRTYSAGVFFGTIDSRSGKEVVMKESQNIWYWDGAASLSQLAVDGTNKPENCKFTKIVYGRILTECIEIIPCTEKACKSIQGVEIWEK